MESKRFKVKKIFIYSCERNLFSKKYEKFRKFQLNIINNHTNSTSFNKTSTNKLCFILILTLNSIELYTIFDHY